MSSETHQHQLLTRYSQGETSTMQVRGALGDISFGELLMKMGAEGLPLPVTPVQGREGVVRRLREVLFPRS
jgi:hypothetical protein